MLVLVAGRKAAVESVIAPAPLRPVRHHEELRVDQPARHAHAVPRLVRAGDLPDGLFLGQVSANFDNVAGFQNRPSKPASLELKDGGAFDGPAMSLSIRAFLFQEYKAVRIDFMKLDHCSFHANRRRGVVVGQRMMGE